MVMMRCPKSVCRDRWIFNLATSLAGPNGRVRPGAAIRNLRLERAKMIFDVIWNFVLPFATGRYKTVRIFIWTLLVVAAGLTFYYS